MKSIRCLLALVLCIGMTGLAKADPIDFKMNVLDPSTGTPEYSNMFNVTFTACTTDELNIIGTSADGCFEGTNDDNQGLNGVGQTWTSLVLTFTNNQYLTAAEPAVCGTLGTSIFTVFDCTPDPVNNEFVLSFSGGAGIGPGDSFLIAEAGVTADDFSTGTAQAGVAPEPNSALLLATGTGFFGLALYAQRRRLLHNPVQS